MPKTDPWQVAAEMEIARQAEEAAAKQAAQNEPARSAVDEAKKDARVQSDAVMRAEIAKLQALLKKRGAAAQALLAAVRPDHPIVFGGYHRVLGGSAVVFTQDGLQFLPETTEYGRGGRCLPASAEEAVYFAVTYSSLEPFEVVDWFVGRLDALCREVHKK